MPLKQQQLVELLPRPYSRYLDSWYMIPRPLSICELATETLVVKLFEGDICCL